MPQISKEIKEVIEETRNLIINFLRTKEATMIKGNYYYTKVSSNISSYDKQLNDLNEILGSFSLEIHSKINLWQLQSGRQSITPAHLNVIINKLIELKKIAEEKNHDSNFSVVVSLAITKLKTIYPFPKFSVNETSSQTGLKRRPSSFFDLPSLEADAIQVIHTLKLSS